MSFWGFVNGAMDWLDPSGAIHTTERQKQMDAYNQNNDWRANIALQHQLDYDKWAQRLTEENNQWQKDFAEKQYNNSLIQYQNSLKQYEEQKEIATHPISTLLNDASKNGVSPMAALGQNVGSFSATGGNSSNHSANLSDGSGSSVSNNQASVQMHLVNSLPALMSNLSDVILTKQKMRQDERMQDKELKFRYSQLASSERLATERNAIQAKSQQALANYNSGKLAIDSSMFEEYSSMNRKQQQEIDAKIRQANSEIEKKLADIEHNKNLESLEKERQKTSVINTVISAIGSLVGSFIR